MLYYPRITDIKNAAKVLNTIMLRTPLQLNSELSNKYGANIYLKREDLTPVRSYKIRGAYNKMSSLETKNIVTCSAGNHAQGVALSCSLLKIHGKIFMPTITPQQKIEKVKKFGGNKVEIILKGDNFDESYDYARDSSNAEFIHPFDDQKVIEGQGTVGLEIIDQMKGCPDIVIVPIGGGGLAAGLSAYIKEVSPKTRIIGVEPAGAPSMTMALKYGKPYKLDAISTFVDGAAVKKVGSLNYPICKTNLENVLLIEEGHICSKILQMYNENGFIIEPAGILSLCALDLMNIKNKTVVSVISGGNSDVFRMPEILDKSLIYEGLKNYMKIDFPQRPGALKEFILNVLGKNDDIIYFRYTKLINKEMGPVIIGLQLKQKDDIQNIITKMNMLNIRFEAIDNNCYI
jgi:threonine dehydratase